MAEQLNRLIEWMVEVLSEAGAEGLSITALFERLGGEFAADDVTKNGVWDGIVAREDVILVDDKKELPLNKSPLKKLALEDLVALGLSERKIRVNSPSKAAKAGGKRVVNSIEVNVEGQNVAAVKRKASKELLPAPPKKRRGRPPKTRDDASQLSSLADPSTPASSPAAPAQTLQTLTSPATAASTTRAPSTRKRTQTIKAVEGPPTKKPRKGKLLVESPATPAPQTTAITELFESNDSLEPRITLDVFDSAQPDTRPRPRSSQKSPPLVQPAVALQTSDVPAVVSNSTPALLHKDTTTKRNKPVPEAAPQSLPNVRATVEETALPNTTTPAIEQSAQPSQDENSQNEEETTKSSEQASISPQDRAPLSEVTPTTSHKLAAPITAESQQNGTNLAESSIHTSKETSDKPFHIPKRTPKKASPTSALADASPKVHGERHIQQAVFTSQDDMDRLAGVSRVYIDPMGSTRPGIPLHRYGRTTSCVAVFKSAKLRNSEWLEKNNGSWVISFAETIAQRVDEAKKTAPPPKRGRHNKRNTVDEAGEITPSKKRKTFAGSLIDSEIDHNLGTTMDGSEELHPTPLSMISDQLPIQATATNGTSLSKFEAVSATRLSEQVTALTSTSTPLSQQSTAPAAAISKPINAQQQEVYEARILPPQMTGLESGTPPILTPTSTSARGAEIAPTQASMWILSPPRNIDSQPAAPLHTVGSSPPTKNLGAPGESSTQILTSVPASNRPASDVWTNHTVFCAQNGESMPSLLTPIMPSTATHQTPPNQNFAPPLNKYIQRTPDSCAFTLDSQAAATLHLQSIATAVVPARVYASPYESTLETLTSPSISPQSAPHKRKQSRQIPARNFDDGFQKQGTSPAPESFSISSDPAPSTRSLEPTTPGQPLEQPTDSLILTQPPAPPHQNLLAEMFKRPAQTYKSLYTSPYASSYSSPYSSPYASQSGPRAYQEHVTVSQPVSSMQSSLPPAQSSVPGPPKGYFSEQPAHLNPQLSKELFTPKPRSKGRTSASPAPQQANKEARKRRLSEANSQADENQAQLSPSKRRSRAQQKDPTLTEILTNAEAVTVSEGITRLACMYNTLSGNLLLSQDLSILEFLGTRQQPPESPSLVLPISQISQNPIVSMPGSKPRELRIKAKDDNGVDVAYCFSFADTDTGTEAANNMRAKIVTALIAYQFRTGGNYERPDDIQQEILKPYKCEKCGTRFKNKGGLDYHLTKSVTTCNPNCDLTLLAQRKERAEKRKRKSMAPKEPKEPKTPRAPRNEKQEASQALPEPKEKTPQEIEDAEQSDSSTSSDDSIIEFWKNNSTTGVERPRKVGFGRVTPITTSRKPKVYKALPYELSVLREITKDIANIEKPNHGDRTLAEGTSGFAESLSTSEALNSQRCEAILLSLIHDNHYIFPGGRSIWIAFVGVWLKKQTGLPTLPESKLCSKTVDDLVERKELRVTEFAFIDSKKRSITRTILTVPGHKVDSTAIGLLKKSIEESHPAFYVPSQFAPPEPVQSKLNALATRTLHNSNRSQESADVQSELTDSRSQSPIETNEESSDEEFIGDDVEEELLTELGSDSEDAESENEDSEGADDDEVKLKRGTRKRSAAHNKAISEGVRRSWERIKASKSSGYFPNRKHRKNRVPFTQEEKDRRAHIAALRQRSWDFAPAFMPNPETGAWDLTPSKPSRKGYRREHRPRLPEPITYMQAPDGAWSVRPFGHGVNPIYSRPARRAEGNPGFESYRRRLENGFRPVLYPTKNRKFLPAVPSKALLREMTEPNYRPKRPRRAKAPAQRISNITGKPVRTYRKRAGSSQTPDSETPGEPIRDYVFPRWVPNDENNILTTTATGRGSRSADILDEVHLLNFFEPQKLKPGAPRNRGLESIPPSFGLDASRYQAPDLEVHDYQPAYSSLQFIEPQIVEEDLYPGDGSWTVGAWKPFASDDFNIRWDDATTFDLETIPYEHLNFGPDHPEGESPPRPRKRQFVPHQQKQKKLTAEEKYSFTRVLTSLPHDFEGVLENPQDAAEEFGVELAQPNEATLDSRRIKGPRAFMVPEVEKQFIVTVVVIRTLTGGLDSRVDWVLVSQFFQEYSCNFLTKYWVSLQPSRKKIIDRLVTDFQEAFLPAYERGEIPRLDYDHLVDYDWEALIDWVTKNVDTTMSNKPFNLPGSKHEMKQVYDVVELDRDPKGWRESYFGLFTPVYKKIEAASAVPYTVQTQQERTGEDLDDLTLARSWVRATVLTPQQHMELDTALVQERLGHLGVQVVDEVLKAFLSEKVVMKHAKRRTLLGRKYGVTDSFFAPLRKHIRQEVFVQAVRFKRFLDEQFLGGTECVRSDYMANEGSIMVTTTLHAQGRIRLVPIGIPMDKFGLTGGGYETKKIPKEKLRFEIDIYPTQSYVFDSDNEVLHAFFEREPPRGPEMGEIPLWYGISDRIIPDIWKKVLVAVGQVVALRSGINIALLKKIFDPTLGEWEIRILMEWGMEVGVFKRLHERIEGWTVGDEWWLLVGRTCVDGE